jgi:hypothetical protein
MDPSEVAIESRVLYIDGTLESLGSNSKRKLKISPKNIIRDRLKIFRGKL